MYNNEIYNLILNYVNEENILINESMKKHTTLKIGGVAEFFVKAKNTQEIKNIIKMCTENNINLTIIGNGSNMLVKDSGIDGIVLKIENSDINIAELSETYEQLKPEVKENICKNLQQTEKYVIVAVSAGVQLGKLAQILLKKCITGFEFASGIPGTIGGAVKMNAGAYGSEFKDIVVETTCVDMNGNIFTLSNEEQKFKYRSSIFKNEKYIILETKLLLKYVENPNEIKEKMDEYKKSRMEKQPLEFPNAGSTFKRGEDFVTAKLIDECGLKGYKIGGAQISTKHAGFIVNTGNATSEDVLKLVNIIKKNIFDKYKKEVELEIEVVGK